MSRFFSVSALLILTLFISIESKSWTTQTQLFLSTGFLNEFWGVLDYGVLQSVSLSHDCKYDILSIKDGLSKGKPWAFSMLDASGKSTSGLMGAATASLGDYDQCLRIRKINNAKTQIDGKYCLVNIRNTIKSKNGFIGDLDNDAMMEPEVILNRLTRDNFTYAVCLPSSCGQDDITKVFKRTTNNTMWSFDKVALCTTAEEKTFSLTKLSKTEKLCLFVLLTFITLVISATLMELLIGSTSSFVAKFSAINNFRLLITRRDEDERRLLFNDKVRILIVIANFALHALLFSGVRSALFIVRNSEWIWVTNRQLKNQLGTTTAISETIFPLSAITGSFAFFKILNSRKVVVNSFRYLFKWWSRLLIIISIPVAIQILFPFLGSGPAFDLVMRAQSMNCQNNWWKIALLSENLLSAPKEMCIPTLWTVYADFLMQILLTINIIVISYSKMSGIALTWIIMIIGLVIPPAFTIYYDLHPLLVYPLTEKQFVDSISYLFIHSGVHILSFFMAFYAMYLRYTGFRIRRNKDTERRWNAIVIFVVVLSLYWNAPYNVWNIKRSFLGGLVYETFKRPIFVSLAVWVILKSDDIGTMIERIQNEKAGLKKSETKLESVQHELSKPKRPLFLSIATRLLASIYFAHYFIPFIDGLPAREPLHYNYGLIARNIFMNVVMSILCGLLFYLLFEAPLTNMIRSGNKSNQKVHKE